MTGLIVLAVIALALVAALEPNHRRRSVLAAGLAGSSEVQDRDADRIRLDLVAVAARTGAVRRTPAEPGAVLLRRRWPRLWHRESVR